MARSIHDLLADARAARDPGAVDAAVARAVAGARSFHDWRRVLTEVAAIEPVRGAALAAIADRTLAAASADREVWGFRDVATVRAARLADAAGARAALEAGVRTFSAERDDAHPGARAPTPGYQWALLARGFTETLGDAEAARRCLAQGLAMARAHANADDLAAIAEAWAEIVEPADGAALMREAEALADNGSARPWTLANTWIALGDAAAARRVLDAALARAATVRDAVHVLSAWASHGDAAAAGAALARAEQLAAAADEWLELGEAAHDAALGERAVRGALARAAAVAGDAATRGRVARAYKVWLDDDAAAAGLGPRGVRPEALRRPARPLAGWDASAAALFDALRGRATADVLAKIADADYGHGADKHLAALRDICATGLVPRELAWEPHEVLALTRWLSGDHVDHTARALACVLLCLSPGPIDELVTNGVILAESCLALGAEVSAHAERFFAWYAQTDPILEGDEDVPDGGATAAVGDPISDREAHLAWTLLFLLRAHAAPDDPRLAPLARAIATGELAADIADTMRAELWVELAERILAPLRATVPAAAAVLDALGPGRATPR